MPKRCFVISPIGATGSAVREHADDVFDFIVKPAMDELGIEAYRSDHNQQIGRVTDQMYESILEDDLCLAILTFFNPNVFYELAIAQCAARPVIMLIEKGHSIPFDVRDMRAVEYDLRPRPLRDKVYVRQVIDIVRSLESLNWTVEVPFGNQLTPLGNKQRQLRLYDKVENYGMSDSWLSLLRSATTTFDVSGISLRWWTKIAAFRTTFVEKAKAGCKIRVLIMHPDNPALPQYIQANPGRSGLDRLAIEIKEAYTAFADMAVADPNIEVRQIRCSALGHQITKTDTTMLIALVLHSQGTSQSPLLECMPGSPLFQTVENEFNMLWDLSRTADGVVPSVG